MAEKRTGLARLCLAAALWLCACGGRVDFMQARYLESARQYPRALKAYELFWSGHPRDPRVAEALFRAGRIYGRVFDRCPEAIPLFERAARMDALDAGPWPGRARLALLECPDYFPIREGASWTYVDSQSQGKNMRLEIAVKLSSAADARGLESGEMAGAYYAGKNKFRDYRRPVSKRDWSIWEGPSAPILRYPFLAGHSWSARENGRETVFTIESSDAAVEVAAGSFSRCLKVKRGVEGEPAWVYDYYCPGVGRVKTTIGVSGKENPNTELAASSIPSDPEDLIR